MTLSDRTAAREKGAGWQTLTGLLVLILCTAIATRLASRWETDNRPISWMGPGTERTRLEAFVDEFGGDETLVASCFMRGGAKELAWLDGLGPRLAALPAVDACLDPLHLPMAPEGSPEQRLEAARKRPIVLALDAITDERIDWILAIRADSSPADRTALVVAWKTLAAEAHAEGIDLVAAGHPLLAAALDEEAALVDQVFAPALVVAALLVATLFLRSLRLALFTVLPATVASGVARATLAAIGWSSNLILITIGPLVLVLVLASLLHLVARWKRLSSEGRSAIEAAREARRQVLPAALFAGGSTALGFAVFAVSDIEAVRRLGIAVGVTVMIAIPVAYLFVSWALRGMPVKRVADLHSVKHKVHGPWRRLSLASRRRKGLVGTTALAIALLGVVAIVGLEFGTNALDYFPRGHAVREDFRRLEDSGAALSTMEVLVHGLDGEEAAWHEFGDALAEVEGVAGTFGPEDIAAELRHGMGFAPKVLLDSALAKAGRRGKQSTMRWTLRFATGGADHVAPIRERVEALLAELDAGHGTQSSITGSLLGALGMQRRLVQTLEVSLGLTLLVTAALFLLVIRTARELGVMLAVNLAPVASVFIAANLLGYRLDASTVMVAAIVLGLVVDNTFHLLHAAGRGHTRRRPVSRLRAFDRVGEAAFVSSTALMVGFATLAASGFSPTAHFGVLVAIGIAVGLAADFVLLPALWLKPTPALTPKKPAVPPRIS